MPSDGRGRGFYVLIDLPLPKNWTHHKWGQQQEDECHCLSLSVGIIWIDPVVDPKIRKRCLKMVYLPGRLDRYIRSDKRRRRGILLFSLGVKRKGEREGHFPQKNTAQIDDSHWVLESRAGTIFSCMWEGPRGSVCSLRSLTTRMSNLSGTSRRNAKKPGVEMLFSRGYLTYDKEGRWWWSEEYVMRGGRPTERVKRGTGGLINFQGGENEIRESCKQEKQTSQLSSMSRDNYG